jgi:hypothetical protein
MFGLDLGVWTLLLMAGGHEALYSLVGLWLDLGWTLVGLYLKDTSRVFFFIKVSPQHQ